jgi:acyl-CoA thioesterase FadM
MWGMAFQARIRVRFGDIDYNGKDLAVEGQNATVSMHMDSFEKTETPEWLIKGLEAYRQRCAGGA